jgi:hypothetical protein
MRMERCSKRRTIGWKVDKSEEDAKEAKEMERLEE